MDLLRLQTTLLVRGTGREKSAWFKTCRVQVALLCRPDSEPCRAIMLVRRRRWPARSTSSSSPHPGSRGHVATDIVLRRGPGYSPCDLVASSGRCEPAPIARLLL